MNILDSIDYRLSVYHILGELPSYRGVVCALHGVGVASIRQVSAPRTTHVLT
jgi:hypothetical protein